MTPQDEGTLYQRIGEFLVSFQWLEQCFREIGWLLLDPRREVWPPPQLRSLTNFDLLKRVRDLYVETVGTFPGSAAGEYCRSFEFVIQEGHSARRRRNDLLHSAFIELKGGGVVNGILRVNPRLVVDEDGQHNLESEVLSAAAISASLGLLGPLAIAVNLHYTQLIHWAPFDPKPRLDKCGLAFHIEGLPLSDTSGANSQTKR
jgi:hypothetical protein